MSNNFLTHKSLFNTIKFDETIERSGHEDTMFGIELERKGIYIQHIDNPVIHIGLENNEEFITKTEQRLKTLKYLTQRHKNNNLLIERITILKYFYIIKTLKLTGLCSYVFNHTKHFLTKLLLAKDPSMVIYDLYKLGYYSNLSKIQQ
jgi:hypothetical protein